MKVKVLFLVSTLRRCGPTSVIYNIIKQINRTLIETSVLTLSPEPAQTALPDFKGLNVKIFQANLSRVGLLSNGKKIQKMVDQISPQIIHSHSLRPDIFSAKNLNRYIRLNTIHTNLRSNYSTSYNSLVGRILAYRHLKFITHLEASVACSSSVYELYKMRIRALSCIPNGIDTDIFYPLSKDEIRSQRSLMNLPIDRKIFISVGALSSLKDPETVIAGFLKSHSSENSFLLLLGNGPLENTLRLKFKEFTNIMFLGLVSNVADYVKMGDYFISASLIEGLPNTVMEALGCGLPVLLSNIAPHNEILSLNKSAGITFACKDVEGLAKAIDDMTSKSAANFRKAALEIITTKLNAKKMAHEYETIYSRLIKENNSKVFC